jgi:hypothetical protein
MRDCPLFRAEVTYESVVEFYLAAETMEDARRIADKVASRERSSWAGMDDWDVSLQPDDNPHPRAIHEGGGIWVQGLNDGKGGWVDRVEDVPQLPPVPDPNQLVMELHEKPVPRMETVVVPGGAV